MPINVNLIKAMVFPVVMYGCESWTIKKVECQRINSSLISFLYGPTITLIYDHWKSHSFEYTHLCRQCNVSTFIYLFIFVSAFKYAVQVGHSFSSKEQGSFNIMAAVTICSDFGVPKIKSAIVSIVYPSICHEGTGLDTMIFVF